MTGQVYEKVLYEGRNLLLACENVLLTSHPRIVEVTHEEAVASNSHCFTTACWRGFVGEWEIKDGRLMLNRVTGKYRLVGSAPLFAQWFSGELRIPTGPMIEYVHGGYMSKFASEMFLQIENGVVTNTRNEQNAPTYEADGNLSLS